MRDPAGLRPGIIGFKDGRHVAVSEEVSLRENGCDPIEDMTPGALYKIYFDGTYTKKQVIQPNCKHCFFEWNYIAHPDTVLNGVSVHKVRELLGTELADEFSPKADLVTYLPRCPEIAARSYAERAGIDFQSIFYKMKSERAFQGSTSGDRTASIKNNLYVLPHMQNHLEGKRVILIDDSIIRGTNISRACQLLHACKVKEIFALSYTPPIGGIPDDGIPRGCMFGVDMPPDDDFIIRKNSLAQIGEKLGATVHYLSVEGMLKSFKNLGMPNSSLCTFCIGGQHPYDCFKC